ncbi:MAG: hypothetical protein ABIS86_01335 [Streptosporangiaceae bacterium]
MTKINRVIDDAPTRRPGSLLLDACPVAWCDGLHGALLPGTIHSHEVLGDSPVCTMTVTAWTMADGLMSVPVLRTYSPDRDGGPTVSDFRVGVAREMAQICAANGPHDDDAITEWGRGFARAASLVNAL